MLREDFINNRWTTVYFSLIAKARTREHVTGYSERHHILPRSVGGADEPHNIVNMTAAEHLIAHKLLARFSTGATRKKMLSGLWAMAVLRNEHSSERVLLTSREFAKLREEYFQSRRGVPIPDEIRAKISATLTGRSIPAEVIAKRSETLKRNIANGTTVIKRPKLTPEARANATEKSRITREAWSPEKRAEVSKKLGDHSRGVPRPPEIVAKVKAAQKARGYTHSEETRKKIGDIQRGITRPPRMEYTFKKPDGSILIIVGKIGEICTQFDLPVKRLYASLKDGQPLKVGARGEGWQLLSAIRIST